jgi:hypothetical protein
MKLNFRKTLILLCVNASLLYIGLFFVNLLVVYTSTSARRLVGHRIIKYDRPAKTKLYGEGFVPMLSPNLRRQNQQNSNPFPVSGLPDTNTIFCNEGYGMVTYTSTNLGFRPTGASNADPLRASSLIVGDSYAQGACIPQLEFQKPFQGSKIINMAMEGNGLSDYYKSFAAVSNLNSLSSVILILYPVNDLPTTAQDYFKDISSPSCLSNSFAHKANRRNVASHFNLCGTDQFKADSRLAKSLALKHLKAYPIDLYAGSLLLELLKLVELRKATSSVMSRDTASRLLLSSGYSQSGQRVFDSLLQILYQKCGTSSPRCKSFIVILPSSSFWEPDFANPSSYSLAKSYIKHGLDRIRISSRKGISPRYLSCGDKIKDSDFSASGFHLSPGGHNRLWACINSEMSRYNSKL